MVTRSRLNDTVPQQPRSSPTGGDHGAIAHVQQHAASTLAQADEEGRDPIAALETAVGWPALMKARGQVGEIADTVEQDPLVIAADKYATLRRFAPLLIEVLDFQSGRGRAASVKAIEMLRDLNASGKRDVPADAPMPFRKEWRRLVVGTDGRINRRLYETATMAHLRNKLRSGDIWVERSSGYRRFDSYFLSAGASAPIVAGLNLPPHPACARR